jgi:hypothetical protein
MENLHRSWERDVGSEEGVRNKDGLDGNLKQYLQE